jgi:hypothetical protein
LVKRNGEEEAGILHNKFMLMLSSLRYLRIQEHLGLTLVKWMKELDHKEGKYNNTLKGLAKLLIQWDSVTRLLFIFLFMTQVLHFLLLFLALRQVQNIGNRADGSAISSRV